MITEVKAYSAWNSAPTLLLADGGRAETDLIQIRNIDGLDPVKASVNTSLYGAVVGASYVGSSVPSRNLVLTIHPNPDWEDNTFDSLRKLIYSYFMPTLAIRLVFESDDMDPVEIFGYVESVENNKFSKDPEFLVSIICPDPYFKAVDPIVVTGQSILAAGVPTTIDYEGNVQAGIVVKVSWASGTPPTFIGVRIGDPAVSHLIINTDVTATKYFEMSSIPRKKFVQNVDLDTGVIENLLSSAFVAEGSLWPYLELGENEFSVITDQAVQDWELTYYPLYGGL